jgi:two-component system, response regulator
MSEQAIILLADDSPTDVALTQRALKAAHLPNPVQIVTTGQEVIEYLTGAIHARFSGARIPLLILLDLDLPDLTGFEVLEWIRTQESLSEVPVVIYTGSVNESDANRAMHLGANSYWVKPSSFQGLVSLMQLLKSKIGALEINPRRANTFVRSSLRKTGSRSTRPKERGGDDQRANGRVAAE